MRAAATNHTANHRPPLEILVVEDEPDIRESLEEVLSAQGHHVTSASDGAEAMGRLDRKHFDLTICDVRLPKVDGMEVFRRIRRECPQNQVILMSAYGSVRDAVQAMEEKAAHYLAKPFSFDVLLELVDRVARHEDLQRQLAAPGDSAEALLGSSPAMVQLRSMIDAIAASDASVLVSGESGTGKEVVARLIHQQSRRASAPLVAVNCAAFPDTLLEAELFGHERGAFTGAHERRTGRFEAAEGGTLFLDELVEMPLPAQAKLLRVLEERCIHRIGSNAPIPVDVRIVSATNVDPARAVAGGRLREDIYHRLKVFHLHVPPLRERRGDLPVLIRHFHELLRGDQAGPLFVSAPAWAALRHHRFPGNVRELKHVVEHALVLGGGDRIELEHLPEEVRGEPVRSGDRSSLLPLSEAVSDFERDYLVHTLLRFEGKRAMAAKALGISRKTLWQKLKKLGIDDEV